MTQPLPLSTHELERETLEKLLASRDAVIALQNKELQRLLKRLGELTRELAQLKGQGQVRQLELEVARLQRELEALQRQAERERLGHLSEKRRREEDSAAEPGQGEDSPGEDDPQPPPAKPRVGHGPHAQPGLERRRERVELDEADRCCPTCGDTMGEWEGYAEHSHQIDYVPAKIVLVEVERVKYRCDRCEHLESAQGFAPLCRGGRYTVGFGVQVAVAKYLDHLPLERQTRQFARLGLDVSSQSLWDQLSAVASACEPSWAALPAQILSHPVVGLDQTGWPRLVGEKVKRTNWQMWALASEQAVYYVIRDHKDAKTARELLGSYAGVVVCDDLSSHNAAARAGPFRLAGCWAHIRRYFVESHHAGAEEVLERVGELYRIEAELGPVSERSGDAERARRRGTESRAHVEALRVQLEHHLGGTSKQTAFGKAVRHALANWPKLTLFLDDPRVWLDNNLTERCLRGPVVGRRNHFGSKSEQGTKVASILYSLLETAKLCGVEPSGYLRAVVERAREHPGTVTFPWHLGAAELV